MQSSHLANQNANPKVAIDAKPIKTYLGWEIFLSHVFREGTDKGMWLHWYHPVEKDRERAVRYGYFVAPTQPLEAALHAAYQSIEAIVELESIEGARPVLLEDEPSERYWHPTSINV